MNKINILVVSPDRYGIQAFRFLEPHLELQKQFPDEFHVEFNEKPDWNDMNYLEKFNIIFGNKDMVPPDRAKELFPLLQSKGIKIIMDVDDNWHLSPTHPQYQFAKQNKYAERVQAIIPYFDYITTTTEYFAKEIRKHNKNVIVFPNGVDPTNKKWQIKETPSERVRLLWLGGSSHLKDLELLRPMYNSLNEKYKDKLQTVIAGFDLRGFNVYIDENGIKHERPLLPSETCWSEYEKFATSNYQYLPKDYYDFLMKFKEEEYPGIENMPYRRVWTKKLATYSLNYNLGDITLAPLVENSFNSMKSELKVIESGFFKKPIVCSDVPAYRHIIKHGVNGFLVNNNSKDKNFAYYIKKLIDNPELIKEMGNNLYETVKDKYDLRNISKLRAEWYKEILK